MISALAYTIKIDVEVLSNLSKNEAQRKMEEKKTPDQAQLMDRNELHELFIIIFGLLYEALTSNVGNTVRDEAVKKEILNTLKNTLYIIPVSDLVYEHAVFSEISELLERLLLTEGPTVQLIVIEISVCLCSNHPSIRDKNRFVIRQVKWIVILIH